MFHTLTFSQSFDPFPSSFHLVHLDCDARNPKMSSQKPVMASIFQKPRVCRDLFGSRSHRAEIQAWVTAQRRSHSECGKTRMRERWGCDVELEPSPDELASPVFPGLHFDASRWGMLQRESVGLARKVVRTDGLSGYEARRAAVGEERRSLELEQERPQIAVEMTVERPAIPSNPVLKNRVTREQRSVIGFRVVRKMPSMDGTNKRKSLDSDESPSSPKITKPILIASKKKK